VRAWVQIDFDRWRQAWLDLPPALEKRREREGPSNVSGRTRCSFQQIPRGAIPHLKQPQLPLPMGWYEPDESEGASLTRRRDARKTARVCIDPKRIEQQCMYLFRVSPFDQSVLNSRHRLKQRFVQIHGNDVILIEL
jgi:hypothetical protein